MPVVTATVATQIEIDDNGVAWVALPDVALDYSARKEAELLSHPPSYLHPCDIVPIARPLTTPCFLLDCVVKLTPLTIPQLALYHGHAWLMRMRRHFAGIAWKTNQRIAR